MALLKHTVKLSITSDAGTAITGTAIFQANSEANCSDLVLAGTTKEVDLPVTVAKVKSFYMECTGGDVTVKTNSSSSPAQTFALVAGKAIAWNTDRIETNPLTVNITKLYFVNAGAVDAQVKCSFLQDLGV